MSDPIDQLARAFELVVAYCQAPDRESEEAFLARHPDLRELMEPMLRQKDSLLSTATAPSGLADAVAVSDDGVQRVGPYDLVKEVGRGGQAIVYLAEDRRLRRKVALKMLTGLGLQSPAMRTRLLREAEAASKLDHPSICGVYEVNEADGIPYIAMRFVEGKTLAQLLTERKAGGPPEGGDDFFLGAVANRVGAESNASGPSTREEVRNVVELIERVARALHVAHETALVHRDVKPRNIIVTPAGLPVLLDFGLAVDQSSDALSLTQTGQLVGTPAYLAPEQLAVKRVPVDRRADVYALGVTLFECLTLRLPFESATREKLYQMILVAEAPDPRRLNPRIPKDLAAVLEVAMQKDPDRRYQTAEEFADDLSRVKRTEPIHARPPGPGVRLQQWAKRRPALAGLMGTVCLAVVILAILVLMLDHARQGAEDERDRADRERRSAVAAGKEADRQRDAAESARAHAIQERDEAQRQTRIATAFRLVAEAKGAREAFPQRAALLAVEAVVATSPAEEAVFEAKQALHDALAKCTGIALAAPEGTVRTLATSPDGRWLLTASRDHAAFLWNLGTRDPTEQPIALRGHLAPVCAAQFSANARYLATGSEDGTARLWDLKARDPGPSSVVLRGHDGPVYAVTMSPCGRWLATGGADRTARLWDLSAGDPGGSSTRLPGHEREVYSVMISAQGRRLVTQSLGRILRLWDLTQPHPSSQLIPFHPEGVIRAVAVSPDERWLVSVGFEHRRGPGIRVRIWDLAADDPSRSSVVLCKLWRYEALGVSSDRRWLYTGDRQGAVQAWDLAAESPATSSIHLGAHESYVTHVEASLDGRRVVSRSGDNVIRLWETPAEKPVGSAVALQGHSSDVNHAGISPDRRWVATAAESGAPICLWDLLRNGPTRPSALLHGVEDPIKDLRFSADNRWLIASHRHRPPRLWNVAARAHTRDKAAATEQLGYVQTLGLSPDDRWLVSVRSLDKLVQIRDLTADGSANQPTYLSGHEGRILSVAISADSRWLITGSTDETARVWDLDADDPQQAPIVLRGHKWFVSSVAISADNRWVVTGSADSDARLWSLSGEGMAKRSIVLSGHKFGINDLAISRDGRRLVTGSSDGTARVWDLTAENPGAAPIVLRGHGREILAVAISRDGLRVATGSADRTARLWDLAADEALEPAAVLSGHEGPVSNLVMSPDGRWLATGAMSEATARLWDLAHPDPSKAPTVLSGHTGPIAALEFDPHNQWLATASSHDATVRLWDLVSTEATKRSLVLRDAGCRRGIRALAISSDGRRLFTGRHFGTVGQHSLQISDLLRECRAAVGRNFSRAEWRRFFPCIPYRKTFPDLPAGK